MNKKAFILIILSILLYSENNVSNQEKILAQKLFEKVFKQKAKENKLYLPLKINNILQDEIFVKIDADKHLFISKETIHYVLSLLKEDYQKQFTLKKNQKDFYPLSTLNQLGMVATYDKENIMIKLQIPAKLKQSSLLNFNRARNKDLNGSILPEKYAGGANFYLNQSYTGSNKLKSSLSGSSDVFFNFHDTVLEGRFQYREESSKQITRDRFRLLKDDEENQLRYTIGDIILPRQYRMGFTDALGVTVEKKFEINRDFTQNISRVSSYEFFLKNRSKIEVFINEKFYSTFSLNAGTYNLYDLGLPAGINLIKLKITEDSGKIEYIDFSDFSYSEVLQKGVVRYGLGLGIASKKESDEWVYEKKEKLFSSYVDYGITNDITIRTGIQLNNQKYHSQALEFLVGTNLGLFNPYIIYSDNGELKGYKRGLDYRTNIDKLTLNLGYVESDENFKQLSNYQTTTGEINRLYRANIYTPIKDNSNIGFNLSQYIRGDEEENKYGLSFYKRFSKELEFRANFDTIKKDNQKDEERLYFTVDYRFDNKRVSYINYSKENRHQINSDYRSDGRYGINGSLLYEHDEEYNRYYARSNINDEKFKIDATYNMKNSQNQDKSQSASIQLATGFVFAGDSATISTPMNSGFVIVKNSDKLEQALGIEGYQNSDDYIYDSFAIPLSDYTIRELEVDETELDFGVDLVENKQKFVTNFKSGLVMDIEVNSQYSVVGTLFDAETKEPLQNKTFKIFNTRIGKKSVGFTNMNGEFTIQEIEEGQHNVTFFKERNYNGVAKFTFEIQEDNQKSNLIDLGNIYIKIPKKKKVKKYLIYNKKSNQTISENFNNLLKNIYFNVNSYGINLEDKQKLNKIAKELQSHSEVKLDIIGHSDASGNNQYNMELSYKRASSVQEYLQQQGVEKNQLNSLGMGSTQPLSNELDNNRRAEFKGQVQFQVH